MNGNIVLNYLLFTFGKSPKAKKLSKWSKEIITFVDPYYLIWGNYMYHCFRGPGHPAKSWENTLIILGMIFLEAGNNLGEHRMIACIFWSISQYELIDHVPWSLLVIIHKLIAIGLCIQPKDNCRSFNIQGILQWRCPFDCISLNWFISLLTLKYI